jgi:hypothetical protein
MKLMQKERLRQEQIKLELSPAKHFKVDSYKDKQYIAEEKKVTSDVPSKSAKNCRSNVRSSWRPTSRRNGR